MLAVNHVRCKPRLQKTKYEKMFEVTTVTANPTPAGDVAQTSHTHGADGAVWVPLVMDAQA